MIVMIELMRPRTRPTSAPDMSVLRALGRVSTVFDSNAVCRLRESRQTYLNKSGKTTVCLLICANGGDDEVGLETRW